MKKLKKSKDIKKVKASKNTEKNTVKENVITLTGKRIKSINELKNAIEKLGFREIDIKKNVMTVKVVERETIKGAPYLYISITFEPDKMVVEYNVPKDYSKNLRAFEVASLLLRILLLTKAYDIKSEKIYKMIFDVFDTVNEILTKDYVKLKSRYDNLAEEHRKLKMQFDETEKINRKINKTMLEIEKRNQEFEERIKKLESVSNETLEEMLIDWLKTNSGRINVYEFSKVNNISPARVEEGLDILMKKGVIEKVE